jgi:hypothetical protein
MITFLMSINDYIYLDMIDVVGLDVAMGYIDVLILIIQILNLLMKVKR